jgi:hypothetical protein
LSFRQRHLLLNTNDTEVARGEEGRHSLILFPGTGTQDKQNKVDGKKRLPRSKDGTPAIERHVHVKQLKKGGPNEADSIVASDILPNPQFPEIDVPALARRRTGGATDIGNVLLRKD